MQSRKSSVASSSGKRNSFRLSISSVLSITSSNPDSRRSSVLYSPLSSEFPIEEDPKPAKKAAYVPRYAAESFANTTTPLDERYVSNAEKKKPMLDSLIN